MTLEGSFVQKDATHNQRHSAYMGGGGNMTPFLQIFVWNLSMTGDFYFYRERVSSTRGRVFVWASFFKIKGHAVGITQFMIHIIKNSIEKGLTGCWCDALVCITPCWFPFPHFNTSLGEKIGSFHISDAALQTLQLSYFYLKSPSSDTVWFSKWVEILIITTLHQKSNMMNKRFSHF